ncbi:intron-binding protein aquarius [Colletotrichum scovillei]|uniref:Pre-mRNA-splicing factor n=1 Tax=Colletotrichum scovillei TaxID=1209932 RepID=A0A9P7R8L1_9PEZI|nr:intron-binding protein aquarius [Colletotrichum scovillei]KAF4783399.1 intron-binding protein aquarius [Colletotrichum scovillei]KAG7051615.1 intron-binding protein aquarius [Colletotrichum scovillei]KAG7070651.1 intron-binding protein aquarius [Colletotrichum scovillei]KAG7078864.1 intron-binding protein aquarius [Colletotrichum scovillei]
MPTAKRQKKSSEAQAAPSTRSQTKATSDRPTVADIEGESAFAQLAKKHWLKTTRSKRATKVKVKNDVLKQEIWDVLERDGFPYKSILTLESLQTLESYLWPGYSDDSSNHHVLLLVLLANVKRREQLEAWSIFEDRPDEFSSLFRRILSLTLDQTLSPAIQTHLLSFLISAFQSLDCAIVRKECAPLVSISIWHSLSTEELREEKLEQHAHVRKAWRAAGKRYDAADDATKAKLRFDRSWLYSLVLHFLSLIYTENAKPDQVLYCERFVEFLTDLQSQLPTRRYVNTLLLDLHILPAMRLSPVFNDEENSLLRDLNALLKHYTFFTIDDQTGAQLSRTEAYDKHCANLSRLQKTSLKHFKEKLTVLALSNYGSIDKRDELAGLLEPLNDEEIIELAGLLRLRTTYPDSLAVSIDRKFLLEALLTTFERRKTFQEIAREMALVPTEQSLFENNVMRTENYDGSHPLALPKLNLQYLSVGDFLWRSLVLYRAESFYGIRKDVESAIRRLRPESRRPGETSFQGFSKMALPTTKPSILEVVPALVGDDKPSLVRAEISIDVRRLNDGIKREWDSLRPDDVVFLLAIQAPASQSATNGDSAHSETEKLGIISIRSAEIIQITDDKGKVVRDGSGHYDSRRRFQLRLDPRTYAADAERSSASPPEAYERINVVMRRSGRENNFKPVLESIRSLTLSEVPIASWFHEVFLGYGDPAGATYKQLPNRIKTIDYRDTFLDWQHLTGGLPGKIVEPSDDVSGSFGPPYVLETAERQAAEPSSKPSKKRRRDTEPALLAEVETVKVSTYKPPNTGPYPVDSPKLNKVRFTPAQIEAITSGTQPGLTVIVGPPGTGKTDVATQVINNIYHNFPEQKTLLIAHSNQALNQLFAKIVALDIDARHLLRLGHGEEELYTEGSFSKHGRVESFLENRDRYLLEVNRLAASIGAPGAHGNSAETAGYFNSVYIQPAWTKFTEITKAEEASAADIVGAFPFHQFFSDAPQPLFSPEVDRETILDVANGCYRHIAKIFSELADAIPFEILRRDKDKANYLLTNEARIIAMTSTHAAMRRGEIASLGFHYDNVVMEEAAQITEIENFIPLAMQKPKKGQMSLQRVVLCGDHFQNSPVIQSMAFRHYANLEQSLFSRLVRLGVPTINLDQQGRARPSIASLYQWRYPKLGNLPHVESEGEYSVANAGFKYDYQFINVPDYKGRGETEPTPHFIQNLGEAEYAVAVYQYMRLLGYPASKISILTTYAGQRALVKDVLAHRCADKTIFGMPKIVTTVDKYQGEQNDYIILSLTRTSRVGYLRDIRRMTVALSRARLGLYILGRREIFEACYELRQAFDQLLARPDKLMLVTGELYQTERTNVEDVNAEVPGEVCMEGVEHLGQYVYQMTNTKVKQLQAEGTIAGGGEMEVLETPLEAVDEAEEDVNDAVEAIPDGVEE